MILLQFSNCKIRTTAVATQFVFKQQSLGCDCRRIKMHLRLLKRTNLVKLIIFLAISFVVLLNFLPERENNSNLKPADFDDAIDLQAMDLLSLEAERIQQLPVAKLLAVSSENQSPSSDNKCTVKHPNLWDINFNNLYWQVFETKFGATIFIYGAYYDDRSTNGPFVRLTAMVDQISVPSILCHLWLNGEESPVVASAVFRPLWHKEWGNYKNGALLPFIITCLMPLSFKSAVPERVSLVDEPCRRATNCVRVFNQREKRGEFAVCVKGLAFRHTDMSVRVVEWLELLKLFGVDRVFFYDLAVHRNLSKVLRYYVNRGFVQVTGLTLPGTQPNFPELINLYQRSELVVKRQNELIPYNDCFYKNMYSFDYILLLDVDEVVVPRRADGWSEMLGNGFDRDAVCARNVYFFDGWKSTDEEIPWYLHTLNHVWRTFNYSQPMEYAKCFHRTTSVLALHNHFPTACIDKKMCSFHVLRPETALLQHYRSSCPHHLEEQCAQLQQHVVLDQTLYRFRAPLKHNVESTLEQLNLLRNE